MSKGIYIQNICSKMMRIMLVKINSAILEILYGQYYECGGYSFSQSGAVS